ncbi:putative ferric-chelate reductase 1 [Oratosquilla oratoria]|uniref:putative ferric-chelate reductase 1 n=1 Tax=Oratosquilla oratoria TaxID=337810 RepID=UPI003F75BC72
MRLLLAYLLGTLSYFVGSSVGFPDGAPIEACIQDPPNSPNHAGSEALSPELSKHIFRASSSSYRPGQVIRVMMSGRPFRGFFIQARDLDTNEWIGTWANENYSKKYDVCSAITHNSIDLKNSIRLSWKAPPSRSGRVYFT